MSGSMLSPDTRTTVDSPRTEVLAIPAPARELARAEVLSFLKTGDLSYSQLLAVEDGVTLRSGQFFFVTLTVSLIQEAQAIELARGGVKKRSEAMLADASCDEPLDMVATDLRSIAPLFSNVLKDGSQLSDESTAAYTQNLASAIQLATEQPTGVSGRFVTEIAEACAELSKAPARLAKSMDLGQAPHLLALFALASANVNRLHAEVLLRSADLVGSIGDRSRDPSGGHRDQRGESRGNQGGIGSKEVDGQSSVAHRRRSVTAAGPTAPSGAVSDESTGNGPSAGQGTHHHGSAGAGVTRSVAYLADVAELVDHATRDLGLLVQAAEAAEMAAAGLTGKDNQRAISLRALARSLRLRAGELQAVTPSSRKVDGVDGAAQATVAVEKPFLAA